MSSKKRQTVGSLHRRLLAVERSLRDLNAKDGTNTEVIGFRVTQDYDDEEFQERSTRMACKPKRGKKGK